MDCSTPNLDQVVVDNSVECLTSNLDHAVVDNNSMDSSTSNLDQAVVDDFSDCLTSNLDQAVFDENPAEPKPGVTTSETCEQSTADDIYKLTWRNLKVFYGKLKAPISDNNKVGQFIIKQVFLNNAMKWPGYDPNRHKLDETIEWSLKTAIKMKSLKITKQKPKANDQQKKSRGKRRRGKVC